MHIHRGSMIWPVDMQINMNWTLSRKPTFFASPHIAVLSGILQRSMRSMERSLDDVIEDQPRASTK